MSYTYITEEITAEWLSFGEEDSVQINTMNVTEIAAMRAEMADLRIKVAHGAATSQMGQGKSVNFMKAGSEDNLGNVRGELVKHGTCLVPACSNEIEAPAHVTKKPTMCRDCWSVFHEGDQASITLKDKRVVTKNPKGRWQKPVIIKALHARSQFAGDYLRDHTYDFISNVTTRSKNQSKIQESLVPAEIKVTAVNGDVQRASRRVFVLTDNCAAIGAADALPYFTGTPAPCQHGVKGVNAQDAAMVIGESQSGALLLKDDQGSSFIGRCGGGLKATPGMLNEIIWSVSQMLSACDRSDGVCGAHVTERNAQLKVAGGRAVDCAVRDGLYGVEGELVDENDPRWLELEHVWLSEPEEYRPPINMDPKVPLLSRANFKVYVLGTTDGANPDELRHVVEKDMEDKDALHALSPFSYMEAMDLSADNQIRILEARHGGLSFKTIGKGMSGKKTAMDVLSAKGWAKLENCWLPRNSGTTAVTLKSTSSACASPKGGS
jgi:hypothetical protein